MVEPDKLTMLKLLFLDIDGVLNNSPCWSKGPELMRPQCQYLQVIIERTGAKIVLTSSWRKWIEDGSMTRVGFARLLHTHGIRAEVVAYCSPGAVDPGERTALIRQCLALYPGCKYVVLDDLPISLPNCIRTNGYRGLEPEHVAQAIEFLQ